ncbi:hypothetical protein GIB67_001218 [Kingdonia uniflora]|uniref:Tr-type G domain-containing protein n=1 Tax=Kingdonia uniflora TaxID=39325 RepID=A0A7J7LG87_9MAGN|nr:hypothetical protein GIB67_001218 [Kingdonia uniflora]
MKSASIELQFENHYINLIESPGHMDFCSKVSSAARLSDSALILVNAVEGVHRQTHAVLRQAWVKKLKPCLAINKIDRLILELELKPMDAFTKLLKIIYEVNRIYSGYESEKYLSDIDPILAEPSGVEENTEGIFQPQKRTVAFVCALDGWGFPTEDFLRLWASKGMDYD